MVMDKKKVEMHKSRNKVIKLKSNKTQVKEFGGSRYTD
jgi:hypothetical protein